MDRPGQRPRLGKPSATSIWLIFGSLALLVYALGFMESSGVKAHRAYCEQKGQKLEKRRNAITIDLLPYPLANFHYACSGEDIFGRPLRKE